MKECGTEEVVRLLTPGEIMAVVGEKPVFKHLELHPGFVRILPCEEYGWPDNIDFDKAETTTSALDWLAHLSEKTWVTDEMLGELVRAFHHIRDLRYLGRS
jgi:hypothetical protein